MLRRCYAKDSEEWLNYGATGVKVCKDWHNFQNFADWFYKNNYTSRKLSLDKDIKYPYGFTGKLYCPEYCCLVSMKLNSKMASIDKYSVMQRKKGKVKNWCILDNGIQAYSSFDKDLVEMMLSEVKLKKLLELRRDLERSTLTNKDVLKSLDIKIYNYAKDVVIEDKKLFLEHINWRIKNDSQNTN